MNSLKKNLGYQTVYQVLTTCLPLITSPYLARVLGAEQQGVFSYTQSVVNYFTLIAMMGVANYGTRTIAEAGDDIGKRSARFWEIYIMQITVSIVSLIGYIVYLAFICDTNFMIAVLQIFYILGCLTDINWLFFGVEKFDITVKRNIVIKCLSVFLILLLVKEPVDLWIYTVIMSGSTFVTNGVLWIFVKRVVNLSLVRGISFKKIKKHIKPNLILFIPLLAMSVYHIMDNKMLCILSNYKEVGYYYNADKIINIPIGIITGIGTVMLPRTSALISADCGGEADGLFNRTIEMVICVSSAMAFGITAIAEEFTPFFFGEGFDPCIMLMIVLSPVLLIKGLSNTARMQYLIPHNMEPVFIQSVFAGAVVNFAVNYSLIPRMGAMGAVIGTLVAETVTCIWQFFCMRKQVNMRRNLLKSIYYIGCGIVMFVIVRFSAGYLQDGFMGIICEIGIGGMAYIFMCLIFWKHTKDNFLRKFLLKRR